MNINNKDPSFFYEALQDYKAQSNTLLTEFYTQIEDELGLEDGPIDINYNTNISYNNKSKRENLKSNYADLQNKIEILRATIQSETNKIGDTINDMRNNEHFATTLNSDYSEIYKYKYLRNWGIFLSILGGAYFFKKLK